MMIELDKGINYRYINNIDLINGCLKNVEYYMDDENAVYDMLVKPAGSSASTIDTTGKTFYVHLDKNGEHYLLMCLGLEELREP